MKVNPVIKYIYSIVIIISLISCKSRSKIILYKDKDILTHPVEPSSIQQFLWKHKSIALDSISIHGKREKELNSIISNLQITSNGNEMGYPRYAFVIKYKNTRDTLYFYDFNAENYLNVCYMVQNDITLKDRDDVLREYLFKHYKKFIAREVYYRPNNNKEYYWYPKE
ncbi:hypothetical protein [Flavobacterium sp.]|uniref:hypothetical protein n=1 Tax=Flavobacterium sp. TaxID=239 RepID=UPI003D2DA653